MRDSKKKKINILKVLLLAVIAYFSVVAIYILFIDTSSKDEESDILHQTIKEESSITTEPTDVFIDSIVEQHNPPKKKIDPKLYALLERQEKKAAQTNDIETTIKEVGSVYEKDTTAKNKIKQEPVFQEKKEEKKNDNIPIEKEKIKEENEENNGKDASKSLWSTLTEKFSSIFNSPKEPTVEIINPAQEMLSEINGEIGELGQRFIVQEDINGVTYIDHIDKPSSIDSMGFYIYMGITSENYIFHRTIIRYSGTEDIGLSNILIQVDNSEKALIIDATDDVYQRSKNSLINEWVDLPPTPENNGLLNVVTSAQQVKLTFIGKNKNIEWNLSEIEITQLKESLYFYNLLKKREELLSNK